jgi:DNA ligase-1
MTLPKPYLAASPNVNLDTEVTYPVLVSIKLDGIRAMAIDGVLYTRTMQPFKPLVQERFSKILELTRKAGLVLDGELYCHDMTFQQITSAVSHEDKIGELVFHVFDLLSIKEWFGQSATPYSIRVKQYWDLCQTTDPHQYDITPVRQIKCNAADEVVAIHEENLNIGFEGSMLRSPQGTYKHGRSTVKERDLRKFKPFETVDGIIVGFKQQSSLTEEAKDRITDKDAFGRSKRGHRKGDREVVDAIGSIEVEYPCPLDGTTKRCFPKYKKGSPVRTEITWDNKEQYLGRYVEVEYMRIGMKDVLRFPRIIRLRPDLDT